MTGTPSGGLTRRSFLRGTAALAAFPAIIPASVIGANPPSERIVMGALGVGSMGQGDVRGFLGKSNVQMVAVCDVDRNHLAATKKIVDDHYGNPDCRTYGDFRDLLAREDLDAVTTALPDHWHALQSVAAARAGLDIYGQKPLARSIREGRAIVDAVHRYQRVWQTGSWQRSVAHFRKGAELVRNGRIGTVRRVEVGLPNGRNPALAVQPPTPPPPELDYDMWLGPAPWRPHSSFGRGSVHWDWRWIMDYSGGQLTDWAGHHIDIAHWGLGADDTGPVKISGRGEYPIDALYDVPYAYHCTCTYADGIEMTVANQSRQPKGMGTRWIGDHGWVHVSRGGISAEPASLLSEQIGPEETRLYESRNHHENFLDCVKSRRPTITPVEAAQRSISAGLLCEIAMLTGRTLHWDPDREDFRNDPGASALLGRAYREPWHL